MQIPIHNLYYILCYALSDFFVASERSASGRTSDHPLDLLCDILTTEADGIVKRGLHLAYRLRESTDGGIRGRIDFQNSIKGGGVARRRFVCVHDELGEDSELNRLLKTTLSTVASMNGIQPGIRRRAARIAGRFSGVKTVSISSKSFAVVIDRSKRHYALSIGICKLIHESIIVDGEGKIRFTDFSRDEVAMRDIFERFVRNLLRHRLPKPFAVGRRRFEFRGLSGESAATRFVPTMMTDVVITSPRSAVVVEVKYVPGATQQVRSKERFRSPHLYQLYAYVRNIPVEGRRVAGLLLYPATDRGLAATFHLDSTGIRVEELDLGRSWWEVERQLTGSVTSLIATIEKSS